MQNNNTESNSSSAENASSTDSKSAQIAERNTSTQFRKNGRNRKLGNKSSGSAQGQQSASCGAVEDMGNVSEKLSGRHAAGHPKKEKSHEHTTTAPAFNEDSAEVVEDSNSDPKGPVFDTSSNEQKPVDISLSGDKRFNKSKRGPRDDFKKAEVTYSAEKPQKGGLFSRIKSIISKIFSSKKSEKKPFDKDNKFRNKDGNFRRREGGNFHRDNRGKGGKNFHRRNNHGRRFNNPNREGGNKGGNSSAPKAGE